MQQILKKIELPSSVSGSVLNEIMKAIPILSAFVSRADNYFHFIQYGTSNAILAELMLNLSSKPFLVGSYL